MCTHQGYKYSTHKTYVPPTFVRTHAPIMRFYPPPSPTAALAVVTGHGGPALEGFLLYLGNHADCTVNKAAAGFVRPCVPVYF